MPQIVFHTQADARERVEARRMSEMLALSPGERMQQAFRLMQLAAMCSQSVFCRHMDGARRFRRPQWPPPHRRPRDSSKPCCLAFSTLSGREVHFLE